MNHTENTTIPHPKIPHIHWCIDRIHFRNLHFHDTFELDIVLEESSYLIYRDKKILLSPGDIILLNPNEAHELMAIGDSTLILCMQISTSFCSNYFPDLQRTMFKDYKLSSILPRSERRTLLKAVFEGAAAYFQTTDNYTFKCVSSAASVLDSLLRNAPHEKIDSSEYKAMLHTADTMTKITNYIQENLTEDSLLQKLATHIGFTPTYMSHYFKKHFHVTFQQYLMNLRIEKALQMLIASDRPIGEICTACGFTDYRQLNNHCNKEFGMSARLYRASYAHCDKSHSSLTPSPPQKSQYLYSDQESLQYIGKIQQLFCAAV